MTVKKSHYERVPTVQCHNCGDHFSPRREPQSGRHYCGERDCQNARRKQHRLDQLERARRLGGAGNPDDKRLIAAMEKYASQVDKVLYWLMHDSMVDCEACGARRVPPQHFQHPGPKGICEEFGSQPLSPKLTTQLWSDQVNPDGSPLVHS